ncbi:MAG: ribonuclease J [Bacillota bacterium]|nr:ribonuclease J [Bacillota bacterium]
MKKNRPVLRVIPLGGVGEIGKNMMAIEYGPDIIVVDAGLAFPDDEMLGIDYVIPDISYLSENRERVRAILITHGHEDHIGALAYILRELDVPVYGPKLALGLARGRFEEVSPHLKPDLRVVKNGDRIQVGVFDIEFLRVSHSIPDVLALAIQTPLGTLVHTADFKFDQTPIDGAVTDFHRFADYGDRGVLLLISDSTNVERPGYTMSERVVGQKFDETFRAAPGRIIVATFASNVHRIQQIIDSAARYDRKVCVAGRSMVNVVQIALELGYLTVPEGVLVDLDELDEHPPEKMVIVTTGSQGEPMSALTRMAMAEHPRVEIRPGDTVIISANPIPGNEKLVARTINYLFKQGAQVIHEAFSGVHVSGHASQEELKLMINLTRPKYFLPVHGEYRHLVKHAQLARFVGVPEGNAFVLENGDVLEFRNGEARRAGKVTAGQVLVDGLGVGDVGNIVLRDRRLLSQDGILIVVVTINSQTGEVVAGPDIVTRGFVYMREAEKLLEEAKERVRESLSRNCTGAVNEWAGIKASVREALSQFLYERTKRRPMILPIIMEV